MFFSSFFVMKDIFSSMATLTRFNFESTLQSDPCYLRNVAWVVCNHFHFFPSRNWCSNYREEHLLIGSRKMHESCKSIWPSISRTVVPKWTMLRYLRASIDFKTVKTNASHSSNHLIYSVPNIAEFNFDFTKWRIYIFWKDLMRSLEVTKDHFAT